MAEIDCPAVAADKNIPTSSVYGSPAITPWLVLTKPTPLIGDSVTLGSFMSMSLMRRGTPSFVPSLHEGIPVRMPILHGYDVQRTVMGNSMLTREALCESA